MTDIERLVSSLGHGPVRLLLERAGEPPLLGLSVGGIEAVGAWRTLREAMSPLGHWPVLMGHRGTVERLKENLEAHKGETSERILAQADEVDVRAWFERRQQGDEAYYEETHGVWPDRPAPTDAFTIPTETLSGEPLAEVWVALVPTPRSWEVPAHMRFGGWNECPSPAEHVAILRYWNQHYGANLVGLSSDVLECSVERSPQSREDAITLAREQFVFCADIVDQGMGTIENLAGALLRAPVWYFWWD